MLKGERFGVEGRDSVLKGRDSVFEGGQIQC